MTNAKAEKTTRRKVKTTTIPSNTTSKTKTAIMTILEREQHQLTKKENNKNNKSDS